MLPTSDGMVFDTRESSEQTVKQQEHSLQGVAQMVMNMETRVCSTSSLSQLFVSECFMFAQSFQQTTRHEPKRDFFADLYPDLGQVEQLTDEL